MSISVVTNAHIRWKNGGENNDDNSDKEAANDLGKIPITGNGALKGLFTN